MSMPQLRIRSGYSYRDAYGRHPQIIARMKEIGCEQAALVDWGTWGHVRYEQAMTKAELCPMYGMEVPILTRDENAEIVGYKPRAWMLARDTKAFYRATSEVVQRGVTGVRFGALTGVVRFSGGALHKLLDSEFDYIDLNPSSYTLAAEGVRRHRETGKPLVITSYNDMPSVEDQSNAYAWEVKDCVGFRTIMDDDELWCSFFKKIMTAEEYAEAVENTFKVAEELKDVRLQKAPIIRLEGDFVALCREGQKSRLERGHIEEWTEVYEARLVEEIQQIQNKAFDSYFLVVSDLVRYAKQHMLVGPARGSSAGSLVCYLMGITEVDPIPHKLLFQRFIDISRADLPDIDIDFEDTKRHLVFEYLQEKYGRWNVVKLGNINTLQALSVMAQVGKKFGIGYTHTDTIRNAIITYSSADERYGKGLEDTFSKTEPGKAFRANFPEAAACMGDLEIHPSHAGVHAAGILVCNDEVIEYATVNEEGVAQLDKPDSEYLNLLKIDALGLRTLGIIGDTGVVTAEQLYSLKLDDQSVLDILNEDKVSGIFQFAGDAVRSVTRSVHVDNFSKIDNLTALARPGPLSSGMAQKYIERAAGRAEVTYEIPQMEKYLGDTYGVFLYQEQIMSVVKEMGLFDWVKTSAIRKAMSGRKGEEYFNKMGADFVAGAVSQGYPEKTVQKIWNEMVTFGAWGFNKSHSVSYAVVTYWTLWLKRYHKLDFAAACLRSAKSDEETIAILRELAKEGISYTAMDPEYSTTNWRVADGRLIGGIQNAKGFGPAKALKYIQLREARDQGPKELKAYEKARAALDKAEVQYADLCEAHTKWGHFYRNPELAGVTSGNPIVGMRDVKDGDDALIICKLVKKVLADENEPIRQKKRLERGKKAIYPGQSQFIDMMCVDDSTDAALRFRIRPEMYDKMGRAIAEEAPKDSWWLIKGWKLKNIDMFIIKNIKRLDPPPVVATQNPEEAANAETTT